MRQASLTQSVSSTIDISVISTGPDYNMSDPVWAINWFDLQSPSIYNLYLNLIHSHVSRVGARTFFKARLVKRVLGSDEDERDMLLIVHYPSPECFLSMIKSKTFQLKSYLRLMSVRNYALGFMKREDDGVSEGSQSEMERKLIYLLHHFQNGQAAWDAAVLKELAAEMDVFTHFAGVKSHLVGRRRKHDKLKTAPFFMDGLVVFSAFEEAQFEELLAHAVYREFVADNASNYIGIFKRES